MYVFTFILFQIDIPIEDPGQTLRSAASDLDRHCLSMPQKWDARLIRVKYVL